MNSSKSAIITQSKSRLAILFILVTLGIVLWWCCREEENLEVFPLSVPERLSLHEQELPTGYVLVKDEAMLEPLHLYRNPGYLIMPAEHAALAPRGGLCSIAAMYRQDDQVRLMLNAVYFRNSDHCEAFIETESKKGLHMAAFRKKLDASEWLIFIASDSEQTYSDAEREAFGRMIQKYQQRLMLELLFDHLSVSET